MAIQFAAFDWLVEVGFSERLMTLFDRNDKLGVP